MAQGHLGIVLRQLRKVIGPSSDDASDRALLERFATAHDQGAFAALVDRHGPMVLGVCRRILGDAHTVEDVFQAAFMVLARKAGSLQRQGSIAGWLYTVARHAALRMRGAEARRKQRERQVPPMPMAATSSDPVWSDLRPVLDEEIGRLPDKYRSPFILCYLEGKTNEEAARLLGCPKGTVLSRLSRARERLRLRLERRGVTLSLAGLASLLAGNVAPAAVPATLAMSTVQAAVLVSGAATFAGASSTAVALMNGVLRDLFLAKLKVALLVFLTLGLVGIGAGTLAYHRQEARVTPHAHGQLESADPAVNEEAPEGPAVLLSDVGRMPPARMPEAAGPWVFATTFTPDGKALVSAGLKQPIRIWDPVTGAKLRELPGRDHINLVALAPNGKTLAAAWNDNRDAISDEISLWETATWTPLPSIRPGHTLHALYFLDDRTLATINSDTASFLTVRDVTSGKEVRRIDLPRCAWWKATVSGDRKVLAAANDRCDNRAKACLIQLFDAATGAELQALDVGPKTQDHDPMAETVEALTFSADGKLLASAERFDRPLPIASAVDVGRAPQRRDPANTSRDFRRIRVWDRATGQEQRRWEVSGGGRCQCLAFSPDSHTLVSRHYETVVLWEARSGAERLRFSERDWQLRKCAVFSPDGKSLAWNEGNGWTRVLDMTGVSRNGQASTVTLTPAQQDELWADLAGADGGRAFRAVQALSAAPVQALPWLRSRLDQEPDGPRVLRALEVLERIGTSTARQQLAQLAGDGSGRERAQAARESLGRLARRDVSTP